MHICEVQLNFSTSKKDKGLHMTGKFEAKRSFFSAAWPRQSLCHQLFGEHLCARDVMGCAAWFREISFIGYQNHRVSGRGLVMEFQHAICFDPIRTSNL